MEDLKKHRKRFILIVVGTLVLAILIGGGVFGLPLLQENLQENPLVIVQTREVTREVTRIVPQEVTVLVPTEVFVVVPEIHVTERVVTTTVETILRETVVVTKEVEVQVPVTVEVTATPAPPNSVSTSTEQSVTATPALESEEPGNEVQPTNEVAESEDLKSFDWWDNCAMGFLAIVVVWGMLGILTAGSRNKY